VLTGPNVILALKVAVVAVTVLLAASIIALVLGRYRLHGRINLAFFILTLVAVLGLEFIIRAVNPGLFDYFDTATRNAMTIHLSFSIPSTIMLPVMLWSGMKRPRLHPYLGGLFLVLWSGTFVTGVFFLPHTVPETP
jgi:hypothetical protein